MVEFGFSVNKSVFKSFLQDKDKQQICFFVIRFTVKCSDRLVATAALKVLGIWTVTAHGFVRQRKIFPFLACFSGLEDNALIQNPLWECSSCLRHVGVSGDVMYFEKLSATLLKYKN